MKISKDAIRSKLAAFADEWKGATREKQDAQQFWNAFCVCFGLNKRGLALYEDKRKRLNGSTGFIDLLIPSKMLVEHKSANKNLDDAKAQAISYAQVLGEEEKPKLLVVCDFQNWRVWDLDTDTETSFKLEDLPKHWELFEVLQTGKRRVIVEEDEANRKAAYAIAELHEALLKNRFDGKDLEVFLTRIVFCLFADDTAIFERNHALRELVEQSLEDGSDLGSKLDELFNEALNIKEDKRQSHSQLAFRDFTYINGDLFKDRYRIPRFNPELRAKMLACAQLGWGNISPAIFGAMFQGVLEHGALDRKGARRELGAHYTSETNILRAIDPLVMDALRAELDACKSNTSKLEAFHKKLANLKFLDPACGCGNFLVITYRELRRIEHDLIERLYLRKGMGDNTQLLPMKDLIRTKVDQFYGIEIDDSAAHIARIALWITDHQMNLEAHKRFRGDTRPTVPIKASPHIECKNALQYKWEELLPPSECSYIVGNPPFIGKKEQNAEQKADMELVFRHVKGAGVLDFVAAWYVKAANYMAENKAVHCAFVSTNSITQGEQVAILWAELMRLDAHIHFAHRAFKWSNEGKGVAAVHCVIVGFALTPPKACTIFDYSEDIKGEPAKIVALQINPYLVDAPTILLDRRSVPISKAPEMVKGNEATDNGYLIFLKDEMNTFVQREPLAEKWFKPYLGGENFLNGGERWCLWLEDIDPKSLREMPEVLACVKQVNIFRSASPKKATQAKAAQSWLFGENRQPKDGTFIVIPKVSSERRQYMPLGFETHDVIVNNTLQFIPGGSLFHFGVLSSQAHMAWMRAVCGRMKSDYQYSISIVYNNFPWPQAISDKASKAIESAAQAVLDARAAYPDSSLADLYDPNTMPPVLTKAHQTLDKAVDAAYKYKGGTDDAPRVAFLFERYQALTSLLPVLKAKRKRAK